MQCGIKLYKYSKITLTTANNPHPTPQLFLFFKSFVFFYSFCVEIYSAITMLHRDYTTIVCKESHGSLQTIACLLFSLFLIPKIIRHQQAFCQAFDDLKEGPHYASIASFMQSTMYLTSSSVTYGPAGRHIPTLKTASLTPFT